MLTAKAFTHGLPEALITDLLGQVDPIILSGNPQYPLLWIALEFGYLAVAKRMVLRGTPFQTSTILLYTDLSHPAVDSFVDWAGSLCEVRSTFLSTILLATQATARLDTSGGAGEGSTSGPSYAVTCSSAPVISSHDTSESKSVRGRTESTALTNLWHPSGHTVTQEPRFSTASHQSTTLFAMPHSLRHPYTVASPLSPIGNWWTH